MESPEVSTSRSLSWCCGVSPSAGDGGNCGRTRRWLNLKQQQPHRRSVGARPDRKHITCSVWPATIVFIKDRDAMCRFPYRTRRAHPEHARPAVKESIQSLSASMACRPSRQLLASHMRSGREHEGAYPPNQFLTNTRPAPRLSFGSWRLVGLGCCRCTFVRSRQPA